MLIIEDSLELRALVAVCLDGWAVLEASSGAEALSLLDGHLPDLVLLDSQLEDGPTQQWFPKLRAAFSGPIVWFSAREPGPEIESELAGHVPKPFDPMNLEILLEAILVAI